MKRSEALKIIEDIVSEVTYNELAKKRAIKILDKLEEAGMTPFGESYGCSGEWDEEENE